MRMYVLLTLAFVFAGCNAGKIAQLEKENRDLSIKLEAFSKAANFDLQAKCAHQASTVFRELGWPKEPMASYVNHYNREFNKCFIEIRDVTVERKGLLTSLAIQDAFEGKSYGTYFFLNSQSKPAVCKVTVPLGEEKPCSSETEFAQLTKPYMEQ